MKRTLYLIIVLLTSVSLGAQDTKDAWETGNTKDWEIWGDAVSKEYSSWATPDPYTTDFSRAESGFTAYGREGWAAGSVEEQAETDIREGWAAGSVEEEDIPVGDSLPMLLIIVAMYAGIVAWRRWEFPRPTGSFKTLPSAFSRV